LAKQKPQETKDQNEAWPPAPTSAIGHKESGKQTKLTSGFLPADALLGFIAGNAINFVVNLFFMTIGSMVWVKLRQTLLPHSHPAESHFGTGSSHFLWGAGGLSLVTCLLMPMIRRPRYLVLTLAFDVGACLMACLNIAFWLWLESILL